MIQYDRWGMPIPRQMPPQERSKRPISVSNELHALIKTLAVLGGESLEQVVSNAVITRARPHLNTTNIEIQTLCYTQMRKAEVEIKERYHGAKSRRSIRMRRINDARRRRSAPTFTVPRPTIY